MIKETLIKGHHLENPTGVTQLVKTDNHQASQHNQRTRFPTIKFCQQNVTLFDNFSLSSWVITS